MLFFHGEGIIRNDIERYIQSNEINNVKLTGRYEYKDEHIYYENCDFISCLIPSDTINSRTLLPNRLYNAVLYGKPIITFEGTYTSNIVRENGLGIVLNSFSNIEKEILLYIKHFDINQFNKNRESFFSKVIKESLKLNKMID